MTAPDPLDKKSLTSWLERSLVPVEPSPEFVQKLRGRLVLVEGDPVLSPWMVVILLVSVVLIIATWFGLGLRLLIGLLALIGLLQRKSGSEDAALS